MADINISSLADRAGAAHSGQGAHSAEPIWDLIELLFFAYRDFVSDPDDVLAKFGFGRAHHRVLHFVNRHPGMKVADLLEVLKITKQSLGRVLKQLVTRAMWCRRKARTTAASACCSSRRKASNWR